MVKFNRVAELEVRVTNQNFDGYIETIKIRNLRIAFQIQKTLSYSVNTASIQLWNLSKPNRAKIKDYGDEITISAGYSQETGAQLLFVGDTTKVAHIFEQPEIITNFNCGDGEKSLNQVIRDFSYDGEISARTVLQNIAAQSGLEIGFFAETENKVYFQGFQFTGMVKDALNNVANYLGLTVSVQNKKIYLTQKDRPNTKPRVIISQSTGMIGVPQRYTYDRLNLWTSAPKQGYKVKTLLRPEILPSDRVRLISKKIDVDEEFYVDAVTHIGDTWGSPWESEFELVGIR